LKKALLLLPLLTCLSYNGAARYVPGLPPKSCSAQRTGSPCEAPPAFLGAGALLGSSRATNGKNTLFTPFGFASRLGRETLSVCVAPPSGLVATTRGTRRQIPLSGNPHQVLAPQGTTLGSAGLTRYLCRETLIKYWLNGQVPQVGRPFRQSLMGETTAGATTGGTPTPDPYGGKPSCRTGSATHCLPKTALPHPGTVLPYTPTPLYPLPKPLISRFHA
jgi:hypothetical protein